MIRPYLTFDGNCEEAINLYKEAFKTEVLELMRFSDMSPNPNFQIPEDYKNRILQARLKFGDDFIRMSDCGPNHKLNAPKSERISLVIETKEELVRYAFSILEKEGNVGMPLEKTFYSPCAGVVFDKFGVMWNFAAQ